jgi:hypothetical protein
MIMIINNYPETIQIKEASGRKYGNSDLKTTVAKHYILCIGNGYWATPGR